MLKKTDKAYQINYTFSDNINAKSFEKILTNLLKKFLISYENE